MWKGPKLEQFVKNCSPWERFTLEKLWRSISSGRNPTLEQVRSVRSPPSEEEDAAEKMCDKLTAAPIPCAPAPLTGRSDRTREQQKEGKYRIKKV